MNHREPRPYAYDDQNTAYSASHMPQHSADYIATNYQYDSAGHYYAAPGQALGNVNDVNPPSPYFRSMTPSLAIAHRYPNASREPRYYNSQSVVGSSSSISQPMYAPQSQQYPSQYLPTSDQRSLPLNHTPNPHHPQFIPTPSEMANSYSNYPHQHSPPVPEGGYASSSLDYPAPPHMVPSSHMNHALRPSRIVTGRPRTVSAATSTSPTSASSPSGERFPCEKCGKTFSRSHDRKRHHETQHLPSPVIHRCVYCQKEFSRADSLKRHLDNGCDEMPS